MGRGGRLALSLACALLACTLLAPAGALAQADDGPLLGGVGSGAKDQGDKGGKETPWSKIAPYELKDPKGVTLLKPTSLIQAIPHVLAEIVWGLALYLLWLALLIFSWAFDVDLMNGPGGALGPVGQTVDGIYSSLGGSFLVAAVLVAGLWALFRGVAQRRYAQTVGGLGLSVLCVAGALWAITDPQATVGQLASWSQDGSAGFLSLTQEAAPEVASEGPGAPLPGSSSAGTLIAEDQQAQTAGGEGLFLSADVSSESDIEATVSETLSRYGALHFAINNAGHSGTNNPVEDQTADNFDAVFDVNVRGLLLCMKHEIRAMRGNEPPEKRKEGWRTDPARGETRERGGYGRIVNIGSAASFIGFPRAGIYIASKHAVHGLTQTAALELAADTDIRVNLLVPGSVKTHNYELFSESRDELKELLIQAHPTRQILLPEDCAPAILFLCSDGAFFSVGQPLFIDGGYTAQ